MNHYIKHIALPAVAPALIVGLYFTPVMVFGCVTRGLIAVSIALISAVFAFITIGFAFSALEKTRSYLTVVDPFGNNLYLAPGLAARATGLMMPNRRKIGQFERAKGAASVFLIRERENMKRNPFTAIISIFLLIVALLVAGCATYSPKPYVAPQDAQIHLRGDIVFLSATELAQKIRSRQLTSLEVVDAFLSQIYQYNPRLNAIVTLNDKKARERAKAADQALAKGETMGAAAWRAGND